MKSTTILSSLILPLAVLAAPTPSQKRSLFGDIMSGLSKLGGDLQGATASGLANTIKQSVTNPALTVDRVEVVSSLASSKTAFQNIATEANTAQNDHVMFFAGKGAKGLSDAAAGVSSIGQKLIAGGDSTNDQKNVAVGIKAALDAVTCMGPIATAAGDQNLVAKIQAANGPVNQLKTAGEGVISSQGKDFVDLGLPENFDTQPADCSVPAPADTETD